MSKIHSALAGQMDVGVMLCVSVAAIGATYVLLRFISRLQAASTRKSTSLFPAVKKGGAALNGPIKCSLRRGMQYSSHPDGDLQYNFNYIFQDEAPLEPGHVRPGMEIHSHYYQPAKKQKSNVQIFSPSMTPSAPQFFDLGPEYDYLPYDSYQQPLGQPMVQPLDQSLDQSLDQPVGQPVGPFGQPLSQPLSQPVGPLGQPLGQPVGPLGQPIGQPLSQPVGYSPVSMDEPLFEEPNMPISISTHEHSHELPHTQMPMAPLSIDVAHAEAPAHPQGPIPSLPYAPDTASPVMSFDTPDLGYPLLSDVLDVVYDDQSAVLSHGTQSQTSSDHSDHEYFSPPAFNYRGSPGEADSTASPDSSGSQERFVCPHCSADFRIKGYLTRHLKKHASDKAYTCPFYNPQSEHKCHPTGGFSRRDTYKTHLKARHFLYPQNTPCSKRAQVAGKCSGCHKQFSSNESWVESHIQANECPYFKND